jgi:multidrug efflux pump subunit AcrA (membrane-fusion protein)
MKLSARLLAPLAVLVLGVFGAVILIATRPEAEAKPAESAAPLVRVVEVRLQDPPLEVIAQGTVAPRTESTLNPKVSGRVLEISPSLVSGV